MGDPGAVVSGPFSARAKQLMARVQRTQRVVLTSAWVLTRTRPMWVVSLPSLAMWAGLLDTVKVAAEGQQASLAGWKREVPADPQLHSEENLTSGMDRGHRQPPE